MIVRTASVATHSFARAQRRCWGFSDALLTLLCQSRHVSTHAAVGRPITNPIPAAGPGEDTPSSMTFLSLSLMRAATIRCMRMQRFSRPKSLFPPTCKCRSMKSPFCVRAKTVRAFHYFSQGHAGRRHSSWTAIINCEKIYVGQTFHMSQSAAAMASDGTEPAWRSMVLPALAFASAQEKTRAEHAGVSTRQTMLCAQRYDRNAGGDAGKRGQHACTLFGA